MIGDVTIQSREVAGKWLVTVVKLKDYGDQREGPNYEQVAACLDASKNVAIVGAVQEWLRSINA